LSRVPRRVACTVLRGDRRSNAAVLPDTGYHAALLAERLGARNVASVEVDPAVAQHARQRLTEQGYGDVTVLTGDGAHGWPNTTSSFDRVIATVAARQVPYAWVAQTRPGGIVLLPWGSEWYPASLLRLAVGEDGVGRGGIVGSANFMVLRSERVPRWGVRDVIGSGHVVTSTTELHPWQVAGQPDAATAVGFRVPDCHQFYTDRGDRAGRLLMVDQASGSWARVTLAEELPYTVEQAGPRRLFDEVTAAYEWWQTAGKPTVRDWLITVSPDGQTIELSAARDETLTTTA
jgi:hypothetical protein